MKKIAAINSMKDAYKAFSKNTYLYKFFNEKDIRDKTFEIKDSYGVEHIIPNHVVVEFISKTKGSEKSKIEDTLRKLDMHNADINHFLEHLAKGLAENYAGALRASERVAKAVLSNHQKKQQETVDKVARSVLKKAAKGDGPIKEVLHKYWNKLHDLEYDLEKASKEYDMAASYNGYPAERDSEKMIKRIVDLTKKINELSMKQFADLIKEEDGYIKDYGTPSAYVNRVRSDIFPV